MSRRNQAEALAVASAFNSFQSRSRESVTRFFGGFQLVRRDGFAVGERLRSKHIILDFWFGSRGSHGNAPVVRKRDHEHRFRRNPVSLGIMNRLRREVGRRADRRALSIVVGGFDA